MDEMADEDDGIEITEGGLLDHVFRCWHIETNILSLKVTKERTNGLTSE